MKGKTPQKMLFTAKEFINGLQELSDGRLKKDTAGTREHVCVRIGDIFNLAKEFMQMSPVEISQLLGSDYYEARIGAVSIMDFQARDKKTTAERKKELFDIYIKRHDRINSWDMVDRSAPYVVGGYLYDKPKDILYKMARSKQPAERRTAIVATYFFIRQGDTAETFALADIMIHDKEEMVQKAVGSWVREAGKKDPRRLSAILDKHAATMPRITLRYAIEKLDKKQKEYYMKLGKS